MIHLVRNEVISEIYFFFRWHELTSFVGNKNNQFDIIYRKNFILFCLILSFI